MKRGVTPYCSEMLKPFTVTSFKEAAKKLIKIGEKILNLAMRYGSAFLWLEIVSTVTDARPVLFAGRRNRRTNVLATTICDTVLHSGYRYLWVFSVVSAIIL